MSASLMFNRVYRLEIQSAMLVFSTPVVNCCPTTGTFFLTSPTPPPLPKVNAGGVELCCRPFSAEFNTLPVKTTFRDGCLYSSLVHGAMYKGKSPLYHSTYLTTLCIIKDGIPGAWCPLWCYTASLAAMFWIRIRKRIVSSDLDPLQEGKRSNKRKVCSASSCA